MPKEEIVYRDPKLGAIVTHLKRRNYTPGDQELYDLIELLVRVNNENARVINRMLGLNDEKLNYEVYLP